MVMSSFVMLRDLLIKICFFSIFKILCNIVKIASGALYSQSSLVSQNKGIFTKFLLLCTLIGFHLLFSRYVLIFFIGLFFIGI